MILSERPIGSHGKEAEAAERNLGEDVSEEKISRRLEPSEEWRAKRASREAEKKTNAQASPEKLPYEPFDLGEELSRARELSRAESLLPEEEKKELRRKRREALRAEWRNQKLGIARTIRVLEEMIEKDPDTTPETFSGSLEDMARIHRFTLSQIDGFRFAIGDYLAKHERVGRWWKKAGGELFKFCFGASPEGVIEAIPRPFTIHFQCYNPSDYAFAYNVATKGGDPVRLSPEEASAPLRTLGVALSSVKIPELQDVITLENTAVLSPRASARIQAHEEQHQMNKLFLPVRLGANLEDAAFGAIERASNSEGAERILLRTLSRVAREHIGFDDRARDEILAQYRGGTQTDGILEKLTSPGFAAFYDYRAQLKEKITKIPEVLREFLAKRVREMAYSTSDSGENILRNEPFSPDEEAVEEAVEEAFGSAYRRDLRHALRGIEVVQNKGYTREEILSIFYTEPLRLWLKVAHRLPGKRPN